MPSDYLQETHHSSTREPGTFVQISLTISKSGDFGRPQDFIGAQFTMRPLPIFSDR
jgi:hypothetical protein